MHLVWELHFYARGYRALFGFLEILSFFVSVALAQPTLTCATVTQAADLFETDPFATTPIASPKDLAPWSSLPPNFRLEGTPLKENEDFRVSRARRLHLGRTSEVAVRQARDPLSHSTTKSSPRIQAEVKIMQAIEKGRHPGKQHVARVVESGRDFLATEWINGRTLFEILNGGKLTSKEAERILTQVREAVAAIHEAGYVHADLHPKNILISNYGEVQIIDLGISVPLGQRHVSSGAPATASENQKAFGRATFADDFHSLGVLESLVRTQVDDAHFSLEPFRALGKELGVSETDPRKFFRAVSSSIRDANHVVPPELRSSVATLNETFGPWFSADLQIKPEAMERPKPKLGTLEVPLPPRYDLHVAQRDLVGTVSEEAHRGVVQWTTPAGRVLNSEIVIRDPVSVETLMSRLPASSTSTLSRLRQLPRGSKITTVLTKTSTSDHRPLAKAEVHLVEDAAGNQTLIIDKVFTDISPRPNEISGSFLALQALNALPNLKVDKIRAVQAWEIVNADTVLAMQEHRRQGKGESNTDRFQGTLLDSFMRSLVSKLGLQLEGRGELLNEKEEPLRNLSPHLPTGNGGGFAFDMPDLGSPVHYDNWKDGDARRLRNAKLLSEYERASGQPNVRDISAVSRFDAVYRVGAP